MEKKSNKTTPNKDAESNERKNTERRKKFVARAYIFCDELKKADEDGMDARGQALIIHDFVHDEHDIEMNDMREMIIAGDELITCTVSVAAKDGPLDSPEANVMWDKLYKAGLMDKRHQPMDNVSHPKCGVIACVMAEKLNLNSFWQLFGDFWNIRDLSNQFSRAKAQNYFVKFDKELEALL